MAYENRKYVIIESSEVSSVDFLQVNETSANTLRYSNDGSQTFVKFDGDTPSFLEGKTSYTHSEILTILSGTDWYEEIE
tara:strand:- start:181 stop:417 length:237 start_codon:yes stop_codon:yes gene_type:complete